MNARCWPVTPARRLVEQLLAMWPTSARAGASQAGMSVEGGAKLEWLEWSGLKAPHGCLAKIPPFACKAQYR